MNKCLLMCLLLIPMMVSAQDEEMTEEEWVAAAEIFMSQLDARSGKIDLSTGNATLDVPEHFRYLNAEDAEAVLVNLWGNPPGTQALGMIIPAGVNLIDDAGWAVVIQYEEEGFVSDEDAADMDYGDLLEDMQEASAEDNEQREAMGYGRVDLVGWARPPHYDAATNKLYWAKELAFQGTDENTLNYNIRVLGRHGVLILNAVANMNQLADIEVQMQDVLTFTNFEEGFQYDDFDPDIDTVAAYGIGALVAGKLAAKAGLLAKLGVLLLVLKKYIVLIVIGVVAVISKLIKGKRKDSPNAGG
jgi:uncharacterized membrane-anchored protein